MNALSGPSNSQPDPLAPSRSSSMDEARFDVTPLVDLVFMMNIFFLVTWITAALAEIDLPAASHCTPADPDTAVIFTILADADGRGILYLGQIDPRNRLADDDELEDRISDAVEAGKRKGADTVIIKAEKLVRLRDVVRIGSAATRWAA